MALSNQTLSHSMSGKTKRPSGTRFWSRLRKAVGLLLLTLNCARAATVTLSSVADSGIEQFHADSNFGTATSMACGELGSSAGNELRRALVRFDLTGQVPPGAIINSVSVNVVVVRVSSLFPTSNFDLRRLLQAWDESAVTWNSRLTSVLWQQPGAEGATDSVSTASASVFVSGVGPYTWSATPDLIADVQAWVNAPTTNFGWLLVSEGEGTPYSACRFATREDPANAPTLVIDYSLPAPSIVTQPQSQTVQVNGTATFSVSASGTPPLIYQWSFFGNPIPNETNDTLVLSNVQTNEAGDYSVLVSNSSGSTNSQAATLTVSPLPVPLVSFVTPTNGARLPAQAQLLVTAQATEAGGVISQIQIQLDGASLGVSTNNPFSLVLTNPAPGTHVLSATALDGFGTSGSNSISFSVFGSSSVTLIQPAPGSTFPLGSNITVTAATAAGGAAITNVLFLADGVGIGQAASPPFSFLWRPAQAQPYALSAVAVDEFGQSVTSSVIAVRVFIPESTPPTLTITRSPPNFAHLTSPSIVLAGTARDNFGLDHIEFQVNNSPFEPASGTNSWTALVPLTAGLNTVRVRSVDLAGNTSALATRFFTLVVVAPIALGVSGEGNVTPDLNGRLLDIGKVFHVSAHPAPGNIFAGWTGALNSNNPALNFQMSSNLSLVASFVPNPFPLVAGTYTGLVLDTNNVAPESAGFLTLRLDAQGSFSGNLAMNAAHYPLHGRFNPFGIVTLPVLRRTRAPVVLGLQLALSAGGDTLSGFATTAVGTNVLSSGLLARRNVFSLANPAPQAGQYRFLLERTPAEGGAIVGTGLAQVSRAGVVRFLGALTDGTSLSLSSALASDGSATFYLPLDGGSGLLLGTVLFPNPPGLGASGSLFWVQSGTNGFTRVLNVAPLSP